MKKVRRYFTVVLVASSVIYLFFTIFSMSQQEKRNVDKEGAVLKLQREVLQGGVIRFSAGQTESSVAGKETSNSEALIVPNGVLYQNVSKDANKETRVSESHLESRSSSLTAQAALIDVDQGTNSKSKPPAGGHRTTAELRELLKKGNIDDKVRSQILHVLQKDTSKLESKPKSKSKLETSDPQRGNTKVNNPPAPKVTFHDYIPSVPVGSAPPKIPHIIHQTWDDENVPSMFSPYIKSWTRLHPDWEYWFWTPHEVEQLLAKHYPEYSSVYSNYSEAIFKANLMRYFIMHHYGGVYADLDLESLRPLDNWTMDNECILSQNHYVHAFISSKRDVAEVMITFLASRPGHPYFKLAIDMLSTYKDMPYKEKLVYAETVYRAYLQTPDSLKSENAVTVTHPDYFLPTYDKGWTGKVKQVCKSKLKRWTSKEKETCEGINDGTEGRKAKRFSYANHYWEHVIMWGKRKEKKARMNIQDIVPTLVFPKP